MPTYNNGPKKGDKVERERRESLSDFRKRERAQERRDGDRRYFSLNNLFSGSNNKSNRRNNDQTNNPIDMPSSNNAPVGQEDWFASLGQSTNPNAFPVAQPNRDNSPSFPTRYRGYVPPVNNNSDNIFRRIASAGLGFALPAYGLAKTGSFLANKIFNTQATNRFDDVMNFRSSRPAPRSAPYYENDIQNSLSTNMGQSLEPNPYIANRAGMFENIVGNNQTPNKPNYSFDRPTNFQDTIMKDLALNMGQPFRVAAPTNFQDTIMKDLALNMGQPFRVGTGAMAEVPYSNVANDPDFTNVLANDPDKWTNYIKNIRLENNRTTNGV